MAAMPQRLDINDPQFEQRRAVRTVRLAVIFTLFMLGIGLVLWKLSAATASPKPTALWIRTEPASGEVGAEVTLRAYVGDQRNRPVGGFKLNFIDGTLLGAAATGQDGWASITHTFDRPGKFLVAVEPDSKEKGDFRLMNRGGIEVTIARPPGG